MISGPAIKAMTPFHRMEAALCEVGREDLAAELGRWSTDCPKVWDLAMRFPDDIEVIARAGWLTDKARRECFTTWQDFAADLRCTSRIRQVTA